MSVPHTYQVARGEWRGGQESFAIARVQLKGRLGRSTQTSSGSNTRTRGWLIKSSELSVCCKFSLHSYQVTARDLVLIALESLTTVQALKSSPRNGAEKTSAAPLRKNVNHIARHGPPRVGSRARARVQFGRYSNRTGRLMAPTTAPDPDAHF